MKENLQTNSQQIQSTLEQFGYKQELKRVLTAKDLVIYGLIIMVPVAPFAIYGIVTDAGHGMAALCYLIAMIAMFFTALSYASMSESFPIAGSVYTYATKGLNTTVGFFAGWAILLDYAFIPGLLYLLSGAALHDIWPAVPIAVWAIIFIVVNTLINVRGIELAAIANKVLLVLQLGVIVYFIVCGLIGVAHGVNDSSFNIKPLFDLSVPISMVMPGVAICVLSYLGFDGISTLAEETIGGIKTVGRATIIALVASGCLFVIECWVAGIMFPDWQSFADTNTSFYVAAFTVGGTALKNTCEFASVIALGFACALSFQTAVARVLYSMSRDELMPKSFSKVHPKYKTPYIATIFVAVINLATCLIFSNMIDTLSCLVNFGALTSFAVLHVAVVNHFVRRTKKFNIIRHIICPCIGFVIIVYIWFNLANIAKLIGLAWMVIGLVYYLIVRFVLKKDTSKLSV